MSKKKVNVTESLDAYNDRELRVQIARFREILTNFKSNMTSEADGVDSGVAYLPTISGPDYGITIKMFHVLE